ncbi:hypothetical protein AAHC03_022555 [Spirometra sp. Aus1]
MLTWRHTALPALLAPAQTFRPTSPAFRAPAAMARLAPRTSLGPWRWTARITPRTTGLSEIRAGARTSSPCSWDSSSSSAVAVLTSSTS